MSSRTQEKIDHLNKTIRQMWFSDVAEGVLFGAEYQSERAVASAFHGGYALARRMIASNSCIADKPLRITDGSSSVLAIVIGAEINSDNDYSKNALDPGYMKAITKALDYDEPSRCISTNLRDALEYLSIEFKGEDLVIKITPCPVYHLKSPGNRMQCNKNQAAIAMATELFEKLAALFMKRDKDLVRTRPHIIREFRDDAITLGATARYLTMRAEGREERIAKKKIKAEEKRIAHQWLLFDEKVKSIEWQRRGGLRSLGLDSIETVLREGEEVQRNDSVQAQETEGLIVSFPALNAGLNKLPEWRGV